MRRWVGVVPVTVLTVLTLVGAVVGLRLWAPPVPGFTPGLIRHIAHTTQDRIVVLDGDPRVARKPWTSGGGDDPVRTDENGCRPRLIAVSYVHYWPNGGHHEMTGWAIYADGFYQRSFGGSGGGFCAESLALLKPRTLRWATLVTF